MAILFSKNQSSGPGDSINFIFFYSFEHFNDKGKFETVHTEANMNAVWAVDFEGNKTQYFKCCIKWGEANLQTAEHKNIYKQTWNL